MSAEIDVKLTSLEAVKTAYGENSVPYSPDNELDFWMYRELYRMRNNIYPVIPEDIYNRILNIANRDPDICRLFDTHFLHGSVKRNGKVAYTPSAEYGRADRQVVTTIGRYLTKHFRKIMSDDEIRDIANIYRAATTPKELRFARSAGEIEDVYMRSAVQSCMTHNASKYDSRFHPVRVYGGSDLSVAYIEDHQKRVTGRAVVHENEMYYVRIYGDDALRILLEQHGFTRRYSFEGARLPKFIDDYDRFIAPYIDGEAQNFDPYTYDDKLIITSDSTDYVCATNGLTERLDKENMMHCYYCDAEIYEADSYYSEYEDCACCFNCYSQYWTYAYYWNGRRWEQDYIHIDSVTYIECAKIDIRTVDIEIGQEEFGYVILSYKYYEPDEYADAKFVVATHDDEIIRIGDAVHFNINGNDYYYHETDIKYFYGLPYPSDEDLHVDAKTGKPVAFDFEGDWVYECDYNYEEEPEHNNEMMRIGDAVRFSINGSDYYYHETDIKYLHGFPYPLDEDLHVDAKTGKPVAFDFEGDWVYERDYDRKKESENEEAIKNTEVQAPSYVFVRS